MEYDNRFVLSDFPFVMCQINHQILGFGTLSFCHEGAVWYCENGSGVWIPFSIISVRILEECVLPSPSGAVIIWLKMGDENEDLVKLIFLPKDQSHCIEIYKMFVDTE